MLALDSQFTMETCQIVVTTLDAPGGTIVGTFSGTVVYPDESDPIVITDGVFDVTRAEGRDRAARTTHRRPRHEMMVA